MTKKKHTGADNKKGNLKVEPVRKVKHIKKISKYIGGSPRDSLLWIMGINNGLRVSDLVKVKYGDVQKLKAGDTLNIVEQKTNKENILVINRSVYTAIKQYENAAHTDPEPDDYLFKSRKGENKPITSSYVGKMIQGWCRDLNIKGRFGAHTLRKTWGYHQRVKHGVGFDVICKRYQHSSPAITMRYLGIEDKEVVDICMHEIG